MVANQQRRGNSGRAPHPGANRARPAQKSALPPDSLPSPREGPKAFQAAEEERVERQAQEGGGPARAAPRRPIKLPLIPGAADRDDSKLRTPAVLYRGEFQLSNPGGGADPELLPHDAGRNHAKLEKKRNSVPGSNNAAATAGQPDWYIVQMRLCKCKTAAEQAVVEDTVRHILKSGVEMASRELSRPLCNLPLTDKPTSRLQTRMLAAWFGTQIAALADHGVASHPVMMAMKNASTDANGGRAEPLQGVPKPVPEYVDQMAERLIHTWVGSGVMPEPFIYFDTNIVRVEGVKVPNDKRYLQAMLQVTSAALALVTHQVGMHCRERGFLLAHIWNLHLGLQEFKMEQVKLRNRALLKEKQILMAKVAQVDLAAQKQQEGELKRLLEFEEFASLKMARLERECTEALQEIVAAGTRHAQELMDRDMRVLQLENDVEDLDAKLTETEGQLDVSMAALLAANGDDDPQTRALKRVRSNLSKGVYRQLDNLRGTEEFLSSEEEERRKNLVLSQTAAAELLAQLGSIVTLLDLEGKDGALQELKASDTEAMQLLELIIKYRERIGAETIGDEEKRALQDEWDRVEDQVDDMALKVLQAANTTEKLTMEELIAKSGIALSEIEMEPVFMDDVDDMKRDEMYDEIKSLREREQAMLLLISKMAELYAAEAEDAPECPYCGNKPPLTGEEGGGGGGKLGKKTSKKKSALQSAVRKVGAVQSLAEGSNPSKKKKKKKKGSADSVDGMTDDDADLSGSEAEDPAEGGGSADRHVRRAGKKGRSRRTAKAFEGDNYGEDEEEDEYEQRLNSRGEMLGMMASLTMGLVKHREGEIEQRKIVARKQGRSKAKAQRARNADTASKKNLMAEDEFEAFMDSIEDDEEDGPESSAVKQALKRSTSGMRSMAGSARAGGGSDDDDDDDDDEDGGTSPIAASGSSRCSMKRLNSKKSARSGRRLERMQSGMADEEDGEDGDGDGAAVTGAAGKRSLHSRKSMGAAANAGVSSSDDEADADAEPPLTADEAEEASNQLERLVARIKNKKPELLKGFDVSLLLRMQKQVAHSSGGLMAAASGAGAGPLTSILKGIKKGAATQAAGGRAQKGVAGARGQLQGGSQLARDLGQGGLRPDSMSPRSSLQLPGSSSLDGSRGLSRMLGGPMRGSTGLDGTWTPDSQHGLGGSRLERGKAAPKLHSEPLREALNPPGRPSERVDLSTDKDTTKKAPERHRFHARDKTLISALAAHPNASPRSPEWAIKVIEGIYKTLAEKVATSKKASQAADINMPRQLMAHFASQYGAKTIVEEYAAQMIATLKKHATKDTRLQIFSSFLSEDWGVPVIEHFLEASSLSQSPGSIAVACVEYPRTKRGAASICAVKAACLAEHMLMKRPKEVSGAFEAAVLKASVLAEDKEKAAHFWSPAEGVTLQTLEEASGPMRKVPLPKFLWILCTEYKRLEDEMETLLPELYNILDKNENGFMSRDEFEQLKDITGGTAEEAEQLWQACLAAKSPQAGAELGVPEAEVNFAAFLEGCMNPRIPLIRRYMRLNKSTPPPPAGEAEGSGGGLKMQMKGIVTAVWEEMEPSMQEILKDTSLSTEAGGLRAQISKVKGGEGGEGSEASAFTKLVKSLIMHKLDFCLKEWRNLQQGSEDGMSALEGGLRAMAQALMALFGVAQTAAPPAPAMPPAPTDASQAGPMSEPAAEEGPVAEEGAGAPAATQQLQSGQAGADNAAATGGPLTLAPDGDPATVALEHQQADAAPTPHGEPREGFPDEAAALPDDAPSGALASTAEG